LTLNSRCLGCRSLRYPYLHVLAFTFESCRFGTSVRRFRRMTNSLAGHVNAVSRQTIHGASGTLEAEDVVPMNRAISSASLVCKMPYLPALLPFVAFPSLKYEDLRSPYTAYSSPLHPESIHQSRSSMATPILTIQALGKVSSILHVLRQPSHLPVHPIHSILKHPVGKMHAIKFNLQARSFAQLLLRPVIQQKVCNLGTDPSDGHNISSVMIFPR
jgi:hypothetical protein